MLPSHKDSTEVRRLKAKHAWLASGTVYGYRKITRELRETGVATGFDA